MPSFNFGALLTRGAALARRAAPLLKQTPYYLERAGAQFPRAAKIARRAAPYLAGGAAAGALYGGAQMFDEEPMRRRRSINPMNHRAAMRAIRRITKVRKILRRIEGKMPKSRCSKPHAKRWGRR